MRRLWYRIRPYVLGDLVADFDCQWVFDESGKPYSRCLTPGRVHRVRRKLRARS